MVVIYSALLVTMSGQILSLSLHMVHLMVGWVGKELSCDVFLLPQADLGSLMLIINATVKGSKARSLPYIPTYDYLCSKPG